MAARGEDTPPKSGAEHDRGNSSTSAGAADQWQARVSRAQGKLTDRVDAGQLRSDEGFGGTGRRAAGRGIYLEEEARGDGMEILGVGSQFFVALSSVACWKLGELNRFGWSLGGQHPGGGLGTL
ncbi:hypothetical protein G7046_g7822 [Stylonectria norvegica]|nr:hypothetical protein G7046_g7822 [Stylonectria norvegica]